MTIRDVLDKIDHDLMVTVYGHGGNGLVHKGLFAPSNEESLNSLISKLGDAPVMDYDTHKNYVLIYLDD